MKYRATFIIFSSTIKEENSTQAQVTDFD